MSTDKIYIIGVGTDGISSLVPEARRMVRRAEVLFGGKRLLDMFPALAGQKITFEHNLDEAIGLIKANIGHKRIVVLASGDPNFYGIAKSLTSRLGKDAVEIIPNVSAMQVAFARVKESWDDAVFASVHARPIENIVDIVRANHKIGLFTDKRHNPSEIAKVLREQGIDDCLAYVCENLGSDEENIISTSLYQLMGMKFSPLNIMILIRDNDKSKSYPLSQQLLGIPEDGFKRRAPERGLITKLEVRVVSLAKLCLTESSIVWDIGAGSGAISIEASLLAWRGHIFAIEKNSEDVAIIRENIQRFRRYNIEVVQALAPDNLEELPDPTAVFVGGSGGQLADILRLACKRLKPGGHIVVNVATLERLQTAVENLKMNGFIVETTLVNIARSKEILDLTRLEALNPVFIVAGWRQAEETNGN